MELKKIWIKTKNALLVLLVACVGLGASSTIAWGNTVQSGFNLNYFHSYRAARTYAIQLQNGMAATFDFRQGTATLYFGPQQLTLPLNQVLLQAANGNSNQAAQMYNQMYGDVTAAHSDAIIKSIGIHTNSLRTLSVGPGGAAGIGDQNDSMWGWPDSGSCWPVPGSCDQWPDGPTGPWGPSTTWWSVPFGSDPLTNTPPNPDNCAPGPDYQDCRDWENNRKNACNEVAADVSEAAVAAAFMYDSCVSAVASGGTLTLGCLATWAGDVIVTVRTENHMFTCQNPWPGN